MSVFAPASSLPQGRAGITEVKWQAKYTRQNGVHVTPTFMVDGLVMPDVSSGDAVGVWLGTLGVG